MIDSSELWGFLFTIVSIYLLIGKIYKTQFYYMEGSPQKQKPDFDSQYPQKKQLFNEKVVKAYEQLCEAVDKMDDKVQLVMKKHQSEFLYAYRTHIKKIKKQLQEIKKKADEQEKMFSANDRIRYLEKQVGVFRSEAIKLYDKLERQSIQIASYRQRVETAELQTQKHKAEKVQLSYQLKMAHVNQTEVKHRIDDLEKEISQYKEAIRNLERRLQKHAIRQKKWKQLNPKQSNRRLLSVSSQPKQMKVYHSELQQWFLDCIKTVKKEIFLRKRGDETLDLSNIKSIAEFKLVDKLKLFELFLQNEKLLYQLYHKIFPTRMDFLAQSLLTPKSIPRQTETGSKTDRYFNQELSLPRVNNKKNEIRNSIIIKNGRMTMSSASQL